MSDRSVNAFWNRLERSRKAQGNISLKELCSKVGIPYQTIVNQKSEGRYPTISMLMPLASELKCSVDWLLFGRTARCGKITEETTALSRKREILNAVLMTDSDETLSAIELTLLSGN